MRYALAGAVTWIAYWFVERAAMAAYFLSQPRGLFRPVSPPWILTLFVVYAVAGALVGAVFGKWGPRIGLAAVFAAGVIANVATASRTPQGPLIFTLVALGQFAVVVALIVLGEKEILPELGDWPAALFLVTPWLINSAFEVPMAVRGALAAGGAIAVLLSAMLIRSAQVRRYLAVAGAVATCALLGMSVFEQTRILKHPRTIRDRGDHPPNVILITIDTLRDDHTTVGGYARDTTPRLAKFARNAWLFPNAYASSDNTLSTHASMFTGLLPTAHGANLTEAYPMGRPIDRDLPLLPDILAKHGYATAGIAGNALFLNDEFGFARGFDSYDQRFAIPPLRHTVTFTIAESVRNLAASFAPAEAVERVCRPASEVTDESIVTAQTLASSGKPFFLFVNYFDAHWPYLPPKSYAARFGTAEPWIDTTRYGDLVTARHASAAERKELIDRYDAALSYTDTEVGRLLDFLRSSRLDERTLIVITSDHGEAFGARGYMSHHASVYDDQIAVPLVVRFPGAAQGKVIQSLASSVDLFATILAAADVPLPAGTAGADLRQPPRNRTIVAEHIDAHGGNRRAIIDDSRKLIVWQNGRRELYAWGLDPGERVDLSTKFDAPDLAAFAQKIDHEMPPRAHDAAPHAGNEHLLRSLGYLR